MVSFRSSFQASFIYTIRFNSQVRKKIERSHFSGPEGNVYTVSYLMTAGTFPLSYSCQPSEGIMLAIFLLYIFKLISGRPAMIPGDLEDKEEVILSTQAPKVEGMQDTNGLFFET